MKRRVICIFMLVFWMITMATFLSIRIEKWMMPTITYIETEPRAEPAEIPADSLFYDDMGIHIYRTRQGQGWEPGLRVWEVSSSDYYVQDGKVRFDQGGGTFICYATRTLRVGEEVQESEPFVNADDQWIGIYPGGVPEYELKSDDITVESSMDNALLLNAAKANVPFMEDRARASVVVEKEDYEWYEPPTSTFYSLNDLRQFMDSMVLLGILAAGMLFTVILWAWSFWLSRDYRKNAKLLLINGGAAAVLLALSPLLLHFINIPNSMLPQYHITEFSHYAEVFGELFGVLRDFAANGSAAAESALRYAESSTTWFFVILAVGIVLGIAVIIAETILGKERKKGRHAAW